MQRNLESLHRATPVPGVDQHTRRTSLPLSVASIPEDGEEVHSKSLPAEKADARGWFPKIGKHSPSQSSKAPSSEYGEALTSRDLPGPRSGAKKPFSLSAQTSPTGSLDSQGSGTTNRSHDSLHRPTPIPSDASSSLFMAPSIGRRSNGKMQPSTPTINEFEDFEEDSDGAHDAFDLGRNSSLGRKSSGSLHRATPVPTDLSSSSSSGPKFTAPRLNTPTIKEDELDRDSRLDSSEYYYGRPQVVHEEEESSRHPLSNDPTAQSRQAGRPSLLAPVELSSNPFATASQQYLKDLPQIEPQKSNHQQPRPVPDAKAQGPRSVDNLAVPSVTSTSTYSPGHGSSPFTPFVDSKDWERDILGVARFLRMCPGLSRQLIGDLLGENNERCLRVLECFTASFDFTGLSFEAALREYLESFRLPGESQKIYRILESWSRQFFRQCPGFFRNSDAVLILAFSLVLLNTDKHNRTVKQKMTCAQFLKSTKGINDGHDFPREFLEELYRNIERRAIRIPPAHQAESMLHRNSLPEPIRATKERYESPKKKRQTSFLCF